MSLEATCILVTGGAGFIGTHLVHELVDHGADVHVLDDLSAGQREGLPDETTFTELDIRSQRLASVVQRTNPDAVVHLAAQHYIPYCNANPEETFNVNVMGTRNLLAAAKKVHELETVVYASSAAVYPPRNGANPEDSPVAPIDIYGRTKLLGEDLVELFDHQTDVSTVTARLFNVYGPGETHAHIIPTIVDQVMEHGDQIELGNLTPKRDFIHVHDVTDALLSLLEADHLSQQKFNIGTGTEYSVREVVECICSITNRDIEIIQTEERTRDTERQHLKADISRIHSELEWEPKFELDDGIRTFMAGDERVI